MIKRFALLTVAMCLVNLGCCASKHKPKDRAVMVPKPPTVLPEQWGSKPQPLPDSRKHTPKFVTIHHAGVEWKTGRDPAESVRAVQIYGQKEKNWPDLPYHFMIAPDGQIFEARPTIYEPESNTKYDLQGHIGVELMGNFETQRPSPAQLKSCVAIVAWVCNEFEIDPSNIAGHRDRAQTTCPGKDFYRYLEDGQFVGWVKETLAGKTPDIQPGEPLKGGPTTVINTASTQPAATQPAR
jgi:hypothetical protein